MKKLKKENMKYFCNPVNYSYKYQFNRQQDGRIIASREGADPSMVLFKGKYLIFPSMTCGFLFSENLTSWAFHATPMLPGYEYAPDVRVVEDWLYFCASNHDKGTHYRTRDPFSDEWERIENNMGFWDPNLFCDEDGRLYFYWGSSTTEPIYGIELEKNTLKPIGEKKGLIWSNTKEKGFERTGENHVAERSLEEQDFILAQMEKQSMPDSIKKAAVAYITGAPYVEGAWMSKHKGKYYLQYGASGSRFNVYGDAVYVSENPLGPFTLAQNNPFSYKPGGFLPGAGHGSTMEDSKGNVWHIATGRICVQHNFERRIGLYPAGWDEDGELFCNQRFGDWPIAVSGEKQDPWAKPCWMLLSYGKPVRASSARQPAANVTDEDIRSYWLADSNVPGQWVEVDLKNVCDVRGIQINFADSGMEVSLPEGAVLQGTLEQQRWIDETHQFTRWLLEGSTDGKTYFIIEDKRKANTDFPHDFIVREKGIQARFLRLTVEMLPYEQAACVSGLRIFGFGHGTMPVQVKNVQAHFSSPLDLQVHWNEKTEGCNVLWGFRPDKLYHCCQVFGSSACIGGLIEGQPVYLRIDSFNDTGITEGEVIQVRGN